MAKLGYDQYQSIRFRTDHSLWGDAGLAFRLQFFHVGRTFTQPVHLYEVVDGQAREILYDPAMFEWDKSGVDPGDDEGPRRLRRLSRAVRHQLARRCRRFPRRELFSRGRRRHAPVRLVGPSAWRWTPRSRARRSFRGSPHFGSSVRRKDSGTLTLYALMDSPSIAGALSHADLARRHAHHERGQSRCTRASRSSAWASPRSPACSSTARTIAAAPTIGGPRFTIPTACRCGPAPANGFGGR